MIAFRKISLFLCVLSVGTVVAVDTSRDNVEQSNRIGASNHRKLWSFSENWSFVNLLYHLHFPIRDCCYDSSCDDGDHPLPHLHCPDCNHAPHCSHSNHPPHDPVCKYCACMGGDDSYCPPEDGDSDSDMNANSMYTDGSTTAQSGGTDGSMDQMATMRFNPWIYVVGASLVVGAVGAFLHHKRQIAVAGAAKDDDEDGNTVSPSVAGSVARRVGLLEQGEIVPPVISTGVPPEEAAAATAAAIASTSEPVAPTNEAPATDYVEMGEAEEPEPASIGEIEMQTPASDEMMMPTIEEPAAADEMM